MTVQAIPRSATRRSAERGSESRALSDWEDLGAYVLLAEPGAGKSWAFEREAELCGGVYAKARDLVNAGPPEDIRGKALFIDGLDEMRAGSSSRDEPLNAIVRCLNELGRPQFRLSCREADWFSNIDHEALRYVAAGGQLEALHLNALTDAEVLTLLRRHTGQVPDAEAFVAEAQRRGLDELLRNPLLLDLMAKAVGGTWPKGRAGVFRLACERLALEHNEHIAVARSKALPALDQTLHDAGLLCAVLLLSGADAWVEGPMNPSAGDLAIASLPSGLLLTDVRTVLCTQLFVADGRRRVPRHRAVAEYLAARALGNQVTQRGLPMSRLLAMMTGFDGGVVEPLRGLLAWLSLSCPTHRSVLIERDPLACVLYGDVGSFAPSDKIQVLNGLKAEAESFAWFRKDNWASHPFGSLAGADMFAEFDRLLADEDRSPAHQSLLECVMNALRYGVPMPGLMHRLERVLRDASYLDHVRQGALKAWFPRQAEATSAARRVLDDIRDGVVIDVEDELCGLLLESLYPAALTSSEVMTYLHPPKRDNLIGVYLRFWSSTMLTATPIDRLPGLADALTTVAFSDRDLHQRHDLRRMIEGVVSAALQSLSDEVGSIERIARWLERGLDSHGGSVLRQSGAPSIRAWLEHHPAAQKGLAQHWYAQVDKGLWPDRRPWSCEQGLHGACPPADWSQWLLQLARQSESSAVAEYLFFSAARASMHLESDPDFDLESLERWVAEQTSKWPQAAQWLEAAGSVPLGHWSREHFLREREDERELAAQRESRCAELRPYRAEILTGRAPPGVMFHVALAYRGLIHDINGESPLERVAAFLVCTPEDAQLATYGLAACLTRDDLPSVAESLALHLKGRQSHLLLPCLIGADLIFSQDAMAPLRWAEGLAQRLSAFWLTYGAGDTPAWYEVLTQWRPELVAPVFVEYARGCLLHRRESSVNGLWSMARDERLRVLARLVMPTLLQDFPSGARASQCRRLNSELLPAALANFDAEELKPLIASRLAIGDMDSAQRMAWLVADMRRVPHRRSGELLALVGQSQVRLRRLAATLVYQSDHKGFHRKLPAAVLGRLIERLAPLTAPERPRTSGWVGDLDHQADHVRGMLSQLAALSHQDAVQEIDRLRSLPGLSSWKTALDAAGFDLVRSVRAANYAHPSADAVALALANGAPANSLDLAALLQHHLRDLQAHLRGGDTNSLQRYWRDPAARDPLPRTENECRDLLKAQLEGKLQAVNVALHKEALHVDDTRADLRAESLVAGQLLRLPVEIKCESHPKLWTAWRDQLQACYLTDPACGGVGIYLVLWFGLKPKKSPEGYAARSPQDLQRALIAAMPHEDRQRVQVVVLDLSMTERQKASVRQVETG